MNCGRETGLARTILTRARFVWPYGGRTVYVSGSFTGWSKHWPMSPVEGYPTVFQIVCSLPVGYHQYKFIVDGEWRHDENQPFVTCHYGTVNTMLLTWEPDYNHVVLSPHVNNEALSRRISEAELEVSRQRINVFLSTHMAYELLPDSGKVIALDVDLLVTQAFHILYEQGISTAPLWDSGKGQFVGVLSALDFILIMLELRSHGSYLTAEELETCTISAWKEAKHGKLFSKRLVQAGPDENLKDVTLKILQNRIATVPVTYSTSDDGSHPQLLYLASLSEVFQIVYGYFGHSASSLPILQRPIYSLPLGTWVPQIRESNRKPLAILRPNYSLSAALSLFLQAEVSSIPIVDENDSLLDVYSRSDIIALAKDKIYSHINLEETTIHQALQLGQERFSSFGTTGQRYHMCLSSDSLHKVMERFAQPGVRRVVIVEAGSKRVEGIISLGDMFRFFLS